MGSPNDIQKMPGLAGWLDLEPAKGTELPNDSLLISRKINPDKYFSESVQVSFDKKNVYLDINADNSKKTDFVYDRLTGLGRFTSNYDATDHTLKTHLSVSESFEKSILENYNPQWADDDTTFLIDELYLHCVLSGLTTYADPQNATIAPPFYYWVHLYTDEFATSTKLEIQNFLIKTIETSPNPVEKRRALVALAFDKGLSDENKNLILENIEKDPELKADLLSVGAIAYSEGWCSHFVYSLLEKDIQSKNIEPLKIKAKSQDLKMELDTNVGKKAEKIEKEIRENFIVAVKLDKLSNKYESAFKNLANACSKYIRLYEENPILGPIILPYNDDINTAINLVENFHPSLNGHDFIYALFPIELGINQDTGENVVKYDFPIKLNPKNILENYKLSGINPVIQHNIVMASLGDEKLKKALGDDYSIPALLDMYQNFDDFFSSNLFLFKNQFLVSDPHFWKFLLKKFPTEEIDIFSVCLVVYSESGEKFEHPPPSWWPDDLSNSSTSLVSKGGYITTDKPEEIKKSVQEALGVIFGNYIGIGFTINNHLVPALANVYKLNPELAILLTDIRACLRTSSWATLENLTKELNDSYLLDLGLHLTIQIVPIDDEREKDGVTIKQREIPLMVLSKIDKLETQSVEGNQVTVYSLTALDYPANESDPNQSAYEYYQTKVLMSKHLVVDTSYVDAEYMSWVKAHPELAKTTTAGPKISLVDVTNTTENRWEALRLYKAQDQSITPYFPLLQLSYSGLDLSNPENKKKIYDDVLEECIVHETNHVKKGFIMGEPAGEYLSTIASLARSNQPHMALFEMMSTMLTYDPATKNFGLRKEILPGGKEIIYATEDSHGLAGMLILNQLASSTGVLKDDELIEELAVTDQARFNEVIQQTINTIANKYNTPEKLRNQALEFENERIQLLREA